MQLTVCLARLNRRNVMCVGKVVLDWYRLTKRFKDLFSQHVKNEQTIKKD